MKFSYEYRTSDNARHSGVVNVPDRDAAYAALKLKGIRPSRVSPVPGFLNLLLGKGKRWLVIAVLVVLSAVLGGLYLRVSQALDEVQSFETSQMRRQVIGDAVVIEKGLRTGWSDVFPQEGERFLASFAVPGVPAGVRSTSETEIRAALSRRCEVREEDGLEARQVKSMVEGMKAELRRYLAAGGTIVEYGNRLVQRQEAELHYYAQVKDELERAVAEGRSDAEIAQLWEARNNRLRAMGIRIVPMPDGQDEHP